MTRTNRVAVVVVLWLVALGLPAHALRLRYTPKVEASHRYTTAMAGHVKMPVAGLTMEMDMSVRSTVDEKVLEKAAKGYKVETSSHDAVMTMTLPGQEEAKSQEVPDSLITAVIDERGAIREVVSSGESQTANPFGVDFLSSFQGISTFPNKEVKPGDTWSGKAKTEATDTVPGTDLTFRSRLVELTTHRGRPCAKIRTAVSGTVKGTILGKMSVNMSLKGTLTDYYDYENSVWVDQEGKLTADMTMEMQGEQAGAVGPMQGRMSVTTTRTLVEE